MKYDLYLGTSVVWSCWCNRPLHNGDLCRGLFVFKRHSSLFAEKLIGKYGICGGVEEL